jgi:hypothetical protein
MAVAIVSIDVIGLVFGIVSPTKAVTEPTTTTAARNLTEPASTSTTTTSVSPPNTAASLASSVAPTTTPSATCPAGACVTLDATRPIGAVNHAGSGINHSVFVGSNDDLADLEALDTTMYRSAPPLPNSQYDWSSWDLATAAGAQTTLVLSDLWAAQTNPNRTVITPWSNWARYTSWVRYTVQSVLASGRTVDYWDVYNEPGWRGYYSPADFAAETPADLLEQFLLTYQAIKSVDPTAAIIGPSTGDWVLSPLPPNNNLTHEPDLATFLRFAAANGLQLAAVAWHDNGQTPATIYSDAMATEALIRSLPALGHPKMFLDEYGSDSTQPIPGWDVGFLAAITNAGFSSAERTCLLVNCWVPALDGLLTNNGESTTSDFYVRVTYAQMSGQMVSASSTTDTVAALGSVNSSKGQVVALIGRDVGCAVASWCESDWNGGGSPAPPISVRVNLVVPWGSSQVKVDLSDEPFEPGVIVNGPTPASPSNLSVTPDGAGKELVSFTIASFADGAAYNLVVTS